MLIYLQVQYTQSAMFSAPSPFMFATRGCMICACATKWLGWSVVINRLQPNILRVVWVQVHWWLPGLAAVCEQLYRVVSYNWSWWVRVRHNLSATFTVVFVSRGSFWLVFYILAPSKVISRRGSIWFGCLVFCIAGTGNYCCTLRLGVLCPRNIQSNVRTGVDFVLFIFALRPSNI